MRYIGIILLAVFIFAACSNVRKGAAVNKRVSNNFSISTGVWR